MDELELRRDRSGLAPAGLVLLTLCGPAAAAWFWNRQGEQALRARTEARLQPIAERGAP
jgi:hypothetical protein